MTIKNCLSILCVATMLSSCTSKKIYDLENLTRDINQFEKSDQMRIIEFSKKYEKLKGQYDSIDDVPVRLVESLSYIELLEQIKTHEDRLIMRKIDFSIRVIETFKKISEKVDTVKLSQFDNPVLLFTQDVLTLPSEIMLREGRPFSQYKDHGADVVIISESMANKAKLKLGDIISIDKEFKIIGITNHIDIIRPYDPMYFLIKTKI